MKFAATLSAFGFLYLLCLNRPGVLEYDEACYAEVSQAMYVSGTALRPTMNGEPFFEKPPFLYWGEMVGFAVLGQGPAGVRLLNALAALAMLGVLGAMTKRALGAEAAWMTVVVLGSSFEFAALARIAMTDCWLTFFMTLSLLFFHRALEADLAGGKGARDFWIACACAGLAMLTKGVVGVLLPGAAVLYALFRERRLRLLVTPSWALPGALLMAGIGLSWYLLLGLTSQNGFAYLGDLFGKHNLERFSKPMEGHSGPVYYYVPVVLLGFMPWSPLVVPALATRNWKEAPGERQRLVRLMLSFAAVTFVFFSIAATKLPNYILPVMPPLALLIGEAWAAPEGQRLQGKGWAWGLWSSGALLGLLGGGLAALPYIWSRVSSFLNEKTLEKVARKSPGLLLPLDFGWGLPVATTLLLAGAVAVAVFLLRRQPERGAQALALSSAATLLVIVVALLPVYDGRFLAPLRNLSQAAAAELRPDETIALLELRHLPSISFHSARRTTSVFRSEPKQVDALFAGPRPAVGIGSEKIFDQVLRGRDAEIVTRDSGYVLFRCKPRESGR